MIGCGSQVNCAPQLKEHNTIAPIAGTRVDNNIYCHAVTVGGDRGEVRVLRRRHIRPDAYSHIRAT